MASIECAIELYDGVSPVLQSMTVALDGFISRLEGLEAGLIPDFQMDTAGLQEATVALGSLAAGLNQVALAGMAAGSGLAAEVFQVQALSMELGIAAANFEMVNLAGAACAAEMMVQFGLAVSQIGTSFQAMQMRAVAVFSGMGTSANTLAQSLPGYFSGPLNTIAAQFQSLASSARSSLASIAAAANAAMAAVRSASASISSSASRAVSAVSSMKAATTLSVTAVKLERVETTAEVALAAEATATKVSVPAVQVEETVTPAFETLTQSVAVVPQDLQEEVLLEATVVPQVSQEALLSDVAVVPQILQEKQFSYAAAVPQAVSEELLYPTEVELAGAPALVAQEQVSLWPGDDGGESGLFDGERVFSADGPGQGRGDSVFHVQVSNENYISSEMDMDRFFRAFEDRLLEALQSSAEGVY